MNDIRQAMASAVEELLRRVRGAAPRSPRPASELTLFIARARRARVAVAIGVLRGQSRTTSDLQSRGVKPQG